MKIRNRLLSGAAAAALVAVGMLGSASSASASSSGCTSAPGAAGSVQCMIIDGSGLHINWVSESYNAGPQYTVNVCQYQGAWQGNFQASGWTIYYSNYEAGCNTWRSETGAYSVGNGWMWDSTFYGYWRSNTTGGNWTSPVAEHIFA